MTVYGISYRAFAPHLTWYSAGDLVNCHCSRPQSFFLLITIQSRIGIN